MAGVVLFRKDCPTKLTMNISIFKIYQLSNICVFAYLDLDKAETNEQTALRVMCVLAVVRVLTVLTR